MYHPPAESAVHRCPTEVWLRIFRFALHIPMAQTCEVIMNHVGVEWQSGLASPYDQWAESSREAALSTGLSLIRVCRSWHDAVDPMMHQWLSVRSWSVLKDPSPLERRINGHSVGSLVRSLDFSLDSDVLLKIPEIASEVDRALREPPEHDEEEYHARIAAVFERVVTPKAQTIVRLCPHIESFSLSSRNILELPNPYSVLTNRLQTFAITGYRELPLTHFAEFLSARASLAVLDISRCILYADTTWTLAAQPVIRPLKLETLSLSATEWNLEFFSFLSSLDLPQLRNVCLDSGNADDFNLFMPILPFLDVHGKRLASLTLGKAPDQAPYTRAIATLLTKCPNLTELVFTLPDIDTVPVGFSHANLYQVGLQGFFRTERLSRFDDLNNLRYHISTIRDIMKKLCSPAFPKLRVIRLLDVVPALVAPPQHEMFEDDYVVLCKELNDLSNEHDIRLEDSLGNAISAKQAFASLYRPMSHHVYDDMVF